MQKAHVQRERLALFFGSVISKCPSLKESSIKQTLNFYVLLFNVGKRRKSILRCKIINNFSYMQINLQKIVHPA